MIFDNFFLPASAYLYCLLLLVVIWTFARGLFNPDERILIRSGIHDSIQSLPIKYQLFSASPFIFSPFGTIWVLNHFSNNHISLFGMTIHSVISLILIILIAKSLSSRSKSNLLILVLLAIIGPIGIPATSIFISEVNVRNAMFIVLAL